MQRRFRTRYGLLGLVVCALCTSPALAQRGASGGEWGYYSGDNGSTKYAPLDQINKGNVQRLRIAWRRPAVDKSLLALDPKLSVSNVFKSTPLMVGGVLYSSNGVGLIEAFHPGTGETIWVQPLLKGEGLPGVSSRGVTYWTDGRVSRILTTRGNYLYALDAKTGQPDVAFGERGRVDLRVGLEPRTAPGVAAYRWQGVPLVVRDVVIVGISMGDRSVKKLDMARGDVRAYDVKTGALRWTFHTIPQGTEFGVDTWEGDSWAYTGAANVWSMMSADEALGYVYLPVAAPASDMYGGSRLGDNLFGNSLVCVKAETGERVWHFQLVHHDLWDYDSPAAPILVDITGAGRPIKAVVQLTKQGFAYVFDRVTGKPVWPIVERPVPQSTTPGERTAATQPFPTKPPPFERQGSTLDNLIDFTPELRAEAIEITKHYVTGPLYTPPSALSDAPTGTKGAIQLPGSLGGANWFGGAIDPETGVLYVPSITTPFAADIVTGNPARGDDLRYISAARPWLGGPRGLPLMKPPYGRITAIDLNRGEHLWMVANGDGPRDHPAIRHLNLPPLGNPGRAALLLTKTLLFIGEGSPIVVQLGRLAPGPALGPEMPKTIAAGWGGNKFKAINKATGETVWEMELPAGTLSAPMTYMFGGKQYIIVTVGDDAEHNVAHPAEYVALALGS